MPNRPQTFPEHVQALSKRSGTRIALKFGSRITTFEQLAERSARLADALLQRGIGSGMRVAYLGKNSDRYFELLLATSRISAVLVPIGWRLAPAEIAGILADAEARLLFVDAHCAAVIGQLDQPPDVVTIDVSIDGIPAHDELVASGQPDVPACLNAAPDAPFLQLYTSGTTGQPKGVILCQRNFFAMRRDRIPGQATRWDQWDEEDVALVAMPVAHIGGTGLGLLSLFNGTTAIVAPEFKPEETLDYIRDQGVSRIFLVPSAIKIMLDSPLAQKTDFSRMKTVVYGSSPIPLELLKEAVSVLGCGFVQTYGMTETMGTIVHLPAEDHDINGNDRMRSAGIPMDGVELAIVGPDGAPLGTGEVGEIVTRSAANMLAYWKRPEETGATLDASGWLRTGDAGYRDADGYVYIVDRIKEMIISGGENVYPAEVENAIYGHPSVSEVAVIGLPDPKWGEAVTAVVVPRCGAAQSPEDIIAWARARIAGFKVPKTVIFADELPKNPTGKTLRRKLRDQLM